MSSECERWIELADREAVGESLSEAARAFQLAHVAVCAECAKETALWHAMRSAPSDGPPSAGEVDEVLRGVAELGQRRQFAARRRRTLLVAAALPVACAAAVALWWRSAPGPAALVEANARSVAAASGRPVLAPGSGLDHSAPQPAAPTAALSPTASCSQPIAGVTVCLGPGTEVTRRALDGADRLLEIQRGRAVVSLVPQPAGTTFSIGTSAGKVTAVGTIFSVEIGSDAVAVARVIRGHVLVRATDDVARPLNAGETLRIGSPTPTPLAAEDRARDLALLSLSAEDEHVDPETPVPLAPSAAGGAKPEPQRLLERARALRARGNFAEAAEVYRKVHAAGPQSASGLAALVSLGELLLSPLNDPQGALTAFDAYLARGGALAQEAAFGRARALRALKRPAEERQAIERYLATYPDAPQGRVLRYRLAALGK
jgi:hypothetical protein